MGGEGQAAHTSNMTPSENIPFSTQFSCQIKPFHVQKIQLTATAGCLNLPMALKWLMPQSIYPCVAVLWTAANFAITDHH
jgi:hypothetical protein